MILGTALTFFVGLFLGLVGGGGSILLLPILHYVMGFDVLIATSLSLMVVGATALIGALSAYRNQKLALREAVLFAIPATLVSFMLRKNVVPTIPHQVWVFGLELSKSQLILSVFLLVSTIIGVRMVIAKDPRSIGTSGAQTKEMVTDSSSEKLSATNVIKVLTAGMLTGGLTAFVGAGGGFLIVPALTNLLKIPFHKAAATSLAIIAFNAAFGLWGDALSGTLGLNYVPLLLPPLAASLIGLFVGKRFASQISAHRLSQVFGFIILVVGLFTLLKEIL